MKRHLTYAELNALAQAQAKLMHAHALEQRRPCLKVFAVPRGGVPAFYLVERWFAQLSAASKFNFFLDPVLTFEKADVVVDDLVDSGGTRARYHGKPFYALITKGHTDGYPEGEWLVFPWEGTEEKSIEDAFVRLIQYIGEDPARGGLLETPARMAKAWAHWTGGYKVDVPKLLKSFEDGATGYDEMVTCIRIPFYSQCEHHLAPFFGTVDFAYVPGDRIVGLSKMNRLVDAFARRLQVQERMTTQIVDAFMEHLKPKGAACLVRARHMCVESRGVAHQGGSTLSSALRGVIKDLPAARAEFYQLIK